MRRIQVRAVVGGTDAVFQTHLRRQSGAGTRDGLEGGGLRREGGEAEAIWGGVGA